MPNPFDQLAQVLKNTDEILKRTEKLLDASQAQSVQLTQILINLQQMAGNQTNILTGLQAIFEGIQTLLGEIPTQPLPTQFLVTLTTTKGEKKMANKAAKATVDFQLADNGTANATLTPVDAAGLPTTLPTGSTIPVWTSSSPSVVVAAASDGMSAVVAPSSPPVLVTGVTITVTATLADGVTVISGTSDPIDVVGSAIAGFTISL